MLLKSTYFDVLTNILKHLLDYKFNFSVLNDITFKVNVNVLNCNFIIRALTLLIYFEWVMPTELWVCCITSFGLLAAEVEKWTFQAPIRLLLCKYPSADASQSRSCSTRKINGTGCCHYNGWALTPTPRVNAPLQMCNYKWSTWSTSFKKMTLKCILVYYKCLSVNSTSIIFQRQ